MSQSVSHEEREASTAGGTPCDVPHATTILPPDWEGQIEYTQPSLERHNSAEGRSAKTNCSWRISAPRANMGILVLLLELKLGTSGMLIKLHISETRETRI